MQSRKRVQLIIFLTVFLDLIGFGGFRRLRGLLRRIPLVPGEALDFTPHAPLRPVAPGSAR